MNQQQFKCKTFVNVETFDFEVEWDVQKCILESLQSKKSIRNSSVFATNFYNSSWSIKLVTNPENSDYFGLYVSLEKADQNLQYAFCSALKFDNMEVIEFDDFSTDFEAGLEGRNSWGMPKWKEQKDLMNEINWSTDFITIIVKIRAKSVEEETLPTELAILNPNTDAETVNNDFSALFKSGLYSDVTLVVDGRKFKVHKAILVSRCQYFETMFGSDFKEATESEVGIKDLGSEEFDYLLQYIYSGKHTAFPRLDMSKLLITAHQLCLNSVVIECEKYLVNNITVDNCIELYIVADTYSCKDLKIKLKEFMKANTQAVMRSVSWKAMKTTEATLLVDLMEFIQL